MLILILINVQYLQNSAFSLEKNLNGQNYSLSDPHHSIEKFTQGNFLPPPPTPKHYLENPGERTTFVNVCYRIPS